MSNKDLERVIGLIKFNALNNLDELVNPGNKGAVKPDLELIDRLVKRPLMLAVSQLENAAADSRKAGNGQQPEHGGLKTNV